MGLIVGAKADTCKGVDKGAGLDGNPFLAASEITARAEAMRVLDVAESAEPATEVPESIAKLCAYAVTTILDHHPKDGPLPNMLIWRKVGEKAPRTEKDTISYADEETVLASARDRLSELADDVEVYAVVTDNSRFDENGDTIYELHLHLGGCDSADGVYVSQEYEIRRFRRGGKITCGPVILKGADSLIFKG